MAKDFEGKTYDEDWNEIDAMGNRIGGGKDWGANRAYDAANDPRGAWNFSPEVKAAHPVAGDQPTHNPSTSFAWDNPGDGFAGHDGGQLATTGQGMDERTGQSARIGANGVAPPPLDSAALLSQLQGPQVAGAGPTSPFGQAVRGSIQAGLADPSVNPNDPAYRGQVDAFNRNAQRSAERMRASAAQRANAQGTLGTGGFDAGVQRILQNQGAEEADFEARLMQSELNAGRDRQARAQQLGAGLFSQEQQQGLTERLANQGAQLQTMGLNNQRDLTSYGANNQRDLARYGGQLQSSLANQGAQMQQRGYNLQRDLGLRDLGLREKQIGNQDSQYYAGLGQQLGLGTAQLNQQALLALLGGG